MHVLRIAVLTVLTVSPAVAQSIDDVIALKRVSGTPAISRDGRRVAFAVRETNWADNAYETEIWIAEAGNAGSARQLTSAAKSSSLPAWSPDGTWVAFISDRSEKRQLYRLSIEGGEAEALTSGDEDVTGFAWSPDGARIAYTMTDAVTAAMKERQEKYGEYTQEDRDHRMAQLHVVDVATRVSAPLTAGAFVVGSFDWSPDGARIAFDHRLNSDAGSSGSADISVVEVASGRTTPLVTQDGPDSNPRVLARRPPDRLPVGDGQAVLLLRERRAGGGQRRGRRAGADHRPLRREPAARRLDPGRDLLLGVAAHVVVPLSARSGEPADCHASGA